MGKEEYQELSSFLNRFIRRFKFLQGVEGICLILICALLLFALGPGIQQITSFFPYAPLAYTVLTALVLVFLLARTVMRLIEKFSQERAALYIEQKRPNLRNNLINSLQLYPQVADEQSNRGFSATLILALLRTTRKQLAGLRVEELIDTRRLKTEFRLLAAVFVPVLAMVLFHPAWVGDTFSLLTKPLQHLPPSNTTIDVTPKGVRVVRGSPVIIHATTAGAIPKSLELILSSAKNDGGDGSAEERLSMESLGNGKFTASIASLNKTLNYRAVTGSFSSPAYVLEAIDPPEIGNLQLTLYPPAYTGLGWQSVPGGNIEGLKGSTVRFDAISTKDVVKADLLIDENKRIPLKIDGRRLQGNLVLFQSQQYRIVVEDAFGFRNSPIAYELRVKPDGFPTIDLLSPTEDLEVNGDEVIPLEYSARDDFGIYEINLSVKIGE
ncbi:MAG TPA: hypothetical protein VFM35_03080, partial [Candidatus Binatia bacterium]|nr:hypothetical protein [Candidatus Binatia bacterium]